MQCRLRSSDRTPGAFSVYRKEPGNFTESEAALHNEQAHLVCHLFDTLMDRTTLNLLSECNEVLGRHEDAAAQRVTEDSLRRACNDVCAIIERVLGSMEVSVFLEDFTNRPGLFVRFGQGKHPLPPHGGPGEYTSETKGLTSSVIRTGKPLLVFDLLHFSDEREALLVEHPGIFFEREDEVGKMYPGYLGLPDEDPLPPLSWMAVLILEGSKVVGVLRCSDPMRGPFFYGKRHLELLELVATQVGRFVTRWRSRQHSDQEILSLREAVDAISDMNQFLHASLKSPQPSAEVVFAKALQRISTVLRGVYAMDVRLFNEQRRDLFFVNTFGEVWNDARHGAKATQKRFSVDPDPPTSVGAHVFKTRRAYAVRDIKTDPYYNQTFEGVQWVLTAPIMVADECIGVVDIRGKRKEDFREYGLPIATLIGQQLGLYSDLINTVSRFRSSEVELAKRVENQRQTFEDLEHQLRGPLVLALSRLQRLFSFSTDSVGESLASDIRLDHIESELFALRGLFRKVYRVAQSTRLFADITAENPLRMNQRPVDHDDFMRMIVGYARDSRFSGLRPAKYSLSRRDSYHFRLLRDIEVRVDRGLLEQALSCLLDNAAKYSNPNTQVEILWRPYASQGMVSHHGNRTSASKSERKTLNTARSAAFAGS